MVTGGDSCPEGHGFESHHRILVDIFHKFVAKFAMFVLKYEKENGDD